MTIIRAISFLNNTFLFLKKVIPYFVIVPLLLTVLNHWTSISFVAMTGNAVFTGSCIHNPFSFKHNHLTSAAAYVIGKSIPANPIVLNFWNGNFLYDYQFTFTTTGKIYWDKGNGITRNAYKNRFGLFGFTGVLYFAWVGWTLRV